MEEGEKLKNKITLFNKKPTETTFNAISKLLSPEKAKAKKAVEDAQVKTKAIKKQVKKISKALAKSDVDAPRKTLLEELEELLTAGGEEAVSKIDSLLSKFRKVTEEAPKAAVAPEQTWARREH